MTSSRFFNPRPVLAVVLAVGVLFTLLAVVSAHRTSRADAEDWLSEQAMVVRDGAIQTVAEVIEDLEAVAAFMETAPNLTERSFGEFVSRIDGSVGQIGVAYLTVVQQAEVEEFLAERRAVEGTYRITRLDDSGELIPLDLRQPTATYYPVTYFAPGSVLELALQSSDTPDDATVLAKGVDAGSTPAWRQGIVSTVDRDAGRTSDFLEIAYTNFRIPKVFFVTVPVHGPDGSVVGLVAAPMLEVLLSLSSAISDEIEWSLESVGTPTTLAVGELSWTGPVELPGVRWELTVIPTEERAAELQQSPVVQIALLGLVTTVLAAAVVYMAMQRRAARWRLESLQRLSEDKDRFLAAVSHEIRTPLTAVHGLAHELAERPEDFSLDEASSLLELVVEQADEVAAIVEDLLVAARTDIGKVSIYPGEVKLEDEVADVLNSTSIPANTSGTAVNAWADPRRTRQIIRNLLTNAQRYGGAAVEVRFESTSDLTTVTVADDGEPISEEQQERIFDPYTSAHEGSPQVGSVGLGLFISRKLARVMGGDLIYRHVGGQSCFTLSLPRADRAAEIRAVG